VICYDTARERVVYFGGWALPVAETWEYDGVNWMRVVTPNSPPTRVHGRLAYDVVRGRTMLFSGRLSSSLLPADTWEYDGSDWTQVNVAGAPLSLEGHALAYDLARGRLVLFGGYQVRGNVDDTAELIPAPVATSVRHGRGCRGSVGTPSLDAAPGTGPALGATFTLRLTSLPSAAGVALLAFGLDLAQWNGVMLPLDLGAVGLPGCRLWTAPAAGGTLLLGHSGGALGFGFVIPANPSPRVRRSAARGPSC
jgi:hypothetical protein